MLILTRKLREEIVVPHCDLTFTILEVHGDKVSIGISAPSEVRVFRKEVWLRIMEESRLDQTLPMSEVAVAPHA